MSKKYLITIEHIDQKCDTEKSNDLGREKKVEATRQYVLTTCVIAGALAAFLIPVRESLPIKQWPFTLITLSVFSYLWVIGQGVLHIMFLYIKELYSKNESEKEDWGWKFEFSVNVHGQFSLFIIGILFAFGVLSTIIYLLMSVWASA